MMFDMQNVDLRYFLIKQLNVQVQLRIINIAASNLHF